MFFIGSIKKTTEGIINAYLKHVYFTLGGSRYILNDRDGKFTIKQFAWLAMELGFIKIYTFLYTLKGNSVIKRTHYFLKDH